MSEKLGRFELISLIAQSPFAAVHKALDTESQQTVALKVVRLDQVQARASLLKSVFDEAEQAKPLSSHNIATLYGVGDEGDLLLAAAEYVQGNSVATTLARKDGFSIWDLQDIARQVCQALDHARGHKAVHHSLEPAKIMVQWDGMVKVLGFGISQMHSLSSESAAVPEFLHYASPEQLRGETCDDRSMIFSLGAILYEMATEQKAFGGDTREQVRSAILEHTPPLPVRLKAGVNGALSELIMKALAKPPDQRYQSGQELVRDLEQCKNTNAGLKSSAAIATPKVKAFAAAAAASSSSAVVAASSPASTAPGLSTSPSPKASAAAPPQESPAKPSFKIDPMMLEEDENSPAAAARKSFSDMSELPPLKEVYVEPTPAPAEEPSQVETPAQVSLKNSEEEKPKIQAREVARKAVKEIRRTPPKLYAYALGVAALLIALIVAGLALHNYLEDRDDSAAVNTPPVAAPQPRKRAAQPAQTPPPQAQPAQPAPEAAQNSTPAQLEPAPAELPASSAPVATGSTSKKSKSKTRTPTVVPAQLTVSSDPAGAQVSFDGNALCESPCTLTGIAPGQHVVSATKAGFASDTRTISLASGANSSLAIELNRLVAKVSVASTPAGGVILIDGKDSGKLTPSVLTLDHAGTHAVIVRRAGYLDETASVDAEPGQTAAVNLALKPLGNTDEIRAAGGSKFKKVFNRGGGDQGDMGIVSVKTQPKGAQIMVNNRVLDKTAPFDFYLNPGTYVLDITMAGYRGVHRVINVEAKERVAIEETLVPE